MKYPVFIVRTFLVTRSITAEIEAASSHHACALVDDGSVDPPAYDDPNWTETRTLEHEEIHPG